MANSPMTRLLRAINIMMTMMGTAVTPLITALQYNARIGSKCMNVMATPPTVANAMTA